MRNKEDLYMAKGPNTFRRQKKKSLKCVSAFAGRYGKKATESFFFQKMDPHAITIKQVSMLTLLNAFAIKKCTPKAQPNSS